MTFKQIVYELIIKIKSQTDEVVDPFWLEQDDKDLISCHILINIPNKMQAVTCSLGYDEVFEQIHFQNELFQMDDEVEALYQKILQYYHKSVEEL